MRGDESSEFWSFTKCHTFEEDMRKNVVYEEISLCLLDKPIVGVCVSEERWGEKYIKGSFQNVTHRPGKMPERLNLCMYTHI